MVEKNKIITVTDLLTFGNEELLNDLWGKKKKLIKERFYKGVQKQRENREGREIDRERNLLVIEVEPKQTFWRC